MAKVRGGKLPAVTIIVDDEQIGGSWITGICHCP
jgi:hypothetical protein